MDTDDDWKGIFLTTLERILRKLVSEIRFSLIVSNLNLRSPLLTLNLEIDGFKKLLEEYWKGHMHELFGITGSVQLAQCLKEKI